MARREHWVRVATGLAGLAAVVVVYLRPGLADPRAHWPLWDVNVYWWGGRQAARGAALYAPGATYRFTYPPFAAELFRIGADAPVSVLQAAITAASVGALAMLCWLVTGVAGIVVAAQAHRRGHRLAGVACCGITGLMVSPFSWTHHWVWAVPLLVTLPATAWRRRSPAYALATVAAATVFSGFIPLAWPGHQPGLRLAASDLYVLCGLAVLAGTALALARERAAAVPRPVSMMRAAMRRPRWVEFSLTAQEFAELEAAAGRAGLARGAYAAEAALAAARGHGWEPAIPAGVTGAGPRPPTGPADQHEPRPGGGRS